MKKQFTEIKCSVPGGRIFINIDRKIKRIICGYCNIEQPNLKVLKRHLLNCEAIRDF